MDRSDSPDGPSIRERITGLKIWPRQAEGKSLLLLLLLITILAGYSAAEINQGTSAVEAKEYQSKTTISEGFDEVTISISCTPSQKTIKINQEALGCSYRTLDNEFTPYGLIAVPVDAVLVVWDPIGEGEVYTQTRLNLSQSSEPYSGGNFTVRAPPRTGWYELKFEPRQTKINNTISKSAGVSFDFEQSIETTSENRYRVYTEDDLLFRQYNQIIVLFGLLVLVPGWISALQLIYKMNEDN